MSDNVQPESAAFTELETLVRHLGDELAGYRRRAQLSEARLRELQGEDVSPVLEQQRELAERCGRLEQENAALRSRVEAATVGARRMLDRVRFIRQQTQIPEK